MQVTPPRNRRKAIIFTVLLHVILGLAVFVGLEFSDYRPLSGPPVDIIQAEVLTEAAPRKLPREPAIEPPPPQPEPEPVLERKIEDTQQEEQKKLIEERERQKQAETKRKEELAAKEVAKQKAVAEAAAKRKAEEAKKQKAEAEAKRKLAAEEEAKRKAAAEQAAREKALQDALAQEQREQELKPVQDAYIAAISQQIARNWLKPPDISIDLKCEALVTQIPDGSVTGARITKSSGNATFDESVIKAIYKAAPLPQPSTPEVFDKELKIAFCSTGTVC